MHSISMKWKIKAMFQTTNLGWLHPLSFPRFFCRESHNPRGASGRPGPRHLDRFPLRWRAADGLQAAAASRQGGLERRPGRFLDITGKDHPMVIQV